MSRTPSFDQRRWWPPFLAGAAAGLLASVLFRRRAGPDGAGEGAGNGSTGGAAGDPGWERWRDAWEDAVEGASEGLASAREMLVGRSAVDLEALEELVSGMACASDCRIRLLGDGIVEVMGSCDSERDAETLLEELAAQPGVEVVVSRVWTPESAGHEDSNR